jgi:hypothetical protein
LEGVLVDFGGEDIDFLRNGGKEEEGGKEGRSFELRGGKKTWFEFKSLLFCSKLTAFDEGVLELSCQTTDSISTEQLSNWPSRFLESDSISFSRNRKTDVGQLTASRWN